MLDLYVGRDRISCKNGRHITLNAAQVQLRPVAAKRGLPAPSLHYQPMVNSIGLV